MIVLVVLFVDREGDPGAERPWGCSWALSLPRFVFSWPTTNRRRQLAIIGGFTFIIML